MKFLFYLCLILLLSSCRKENNFADDITLNFSKDEKLTFQEFNDELGEIGTSLLYIGESKPQITIKYYRYILPPSLPRLKTRGHTDAYSIVRQRFEDCNQLLDKSFFKAEKIQIFETKETFYNLLNSKNLSISVREKDTIPLYKRNCKTTKIKNYKAFPVFIKNISTKVLKIPIDAQGVDLYISYNNQLRYIRNSTYVIRGSEAQPIRYFELKPDEILVYSYPYFKKGEKTKAKIKIGNAASKEFEMSIDENIIKKIPEGFIK